MRDPPSGRVLEQGLDWFLVAIEACSGGTPDLGFFLEVWVYIRGVGVGNKSGGSRGCPQGRGRAQGVGAPPTLMGSPGLFSPTLLLRGLLLVHKKSSKIGTSIGLRLVFLSVKLKNKEK